MQARGAAPVAAGSPQQEVAGTTEDREPDSLRALLTMCASYMPAGDLDLIHRAHDIAHHAHAGTRRVSGEPFIEHPLAVARILASLAMDATGIASALLHDTVEDTSITLDEIETRFGPAIAELVDGVTKFEVVDRDDSSDLPVPNGRPSAEVRAHQQQETVRKLMVAMIRDPRVVLLKLADRLHNMRTLGSMSPGQRASKARETLEIYVPLASGIGLQVFKSELEDLAFYYQQPDEFERMRQVIEREAQSHLDWASRICEQVERRLLEDGIPAAVNWRLKRPYRAYLETQGSGMDPADLHDLIAFRVLVNSELECYQAMGCVHSLWHPMDRIRDYIATPKVNGYRSLHTAVFAFDDRKAQFHIRTHVMHRRVQHGVAAQWLERAAHGERVDGAWRLAVEELPTWVAQLDDWHRELRLSAAEFVDALKRDLFDDQVFVFTPKGDIIDLPAGSTPLDFAYRIHTRLGDHYGGARVQTVGPGAIPLMREVSPEYRLQTGDVVNVVKMPEIQVRPDWLRVVRTRNAREHVTRALRAAQRMDEASVWLLGERFGEPEPEPVAPVLHPSGKPADVRLARCCYPCPGDDIVGLPGPHAVVTIHRARCRVLRQALGRRPRSGLAQPLALDWRALPPMTYRMAVAVYGQDHAGLMHELAMCLKDLGINVSGSFARAIQDRNKAIVTLICEIPPGVRAERVFRGLRSIPGIAHVERDRSWGYARGGEDAPSHGPRAGR